MGAVLGSKSIPEISEAAEKALEGFLGVNSTLSRPLASDQWVFILL
jgi:hypothetical protein